MKRPYQVTSMVLMVAAAYIARESLNLEYYIGVGPGPGFFPFWLSLLLGLLAAGMFYQATFQQVDPMPPNFFPVRRGYWRMAAIVLSQVAAILLMAPLGFRLTTLAFLLFLLFALGRQKLLVTLAIAIAGSFGTFYVFDSLLKVPLPVGVLGI